MSYVLLGWYAPVVVLMVRDPLVREIMFETCSHGLAAGASAVATLVRWGGVSLLRCSLHALRRIGQPHEEWCVLDGERAQEREGSEP